MNKKIFTLFMGAIMLVGSAFTVKAQSDIVKYPYNPIKASQQNNSTLFYDIMRADTVKKLPDAYNDLKNHFYVLSITGIGNNTAGLPITSASSQDESWVLFADKEDTLRVDLLSKLDSLYAFQENGSYKFGALKAATWCLSYEMDDAKGQNVVWDFTNRHNGLQLNAPLIYDKPELWTDDTYDGGIGLKDEEMIVSGWHFSQPYHTNQTLQTGMPLYSYITADTVEVFVLEGTYDDANDEGYRRLGENSGWRVTVKKVALNDLVNSDNARTPRSDADLIAKSIENVLYFTLKKIEPFAMNADDWNAIQAYEGFNVAPDADINAKSSSKDGNPFSYKGKSLLNKLKAFEVNDSLYHYGYMNFQYVDNGKWLYVDTAFTNTGNDQYLAFNLSDKRRDSTRWINGNDTTARSNAFLWGESWGEKPDSVEYQKVANCNDEPTVANYTRDSMLRVLVDSLKNVFGSVANNNKYTTSRVVLEFKEAPNSNNEPAIWSSLLQPLANNMVNSGQTVWTSIAIGDSLEFTASPFVCETYDFWATVDAYHADSMEWVLAKWKDMIIENQSKFRAVYDSWADSTWINVYQSRVAYPNYNPPYSQHNPGWPNWWENTVEMFDVNNETKIESWWQAAGSLSAEFYLPSAFSVTHISNQNSTSVLSNTVYGHGIANEQYSVTTGHTSPLPQPYSYAIAYPLSSPNNIDKVMISTADTFRLYRQLNNITPYTGGSDPAALAHIYGYSLTKDDKTTKYQDSLLYIDVQNLQGSSQRILTLGQSYAANEGKALQSKISLDYKASCKDERNKKAEIQNDLYLIRNQIGQYLCVPLWSAQDSIYWVTPEDNEDPTRMPCYQWAVIRTRSNSVNTPFSLVNREFEGVKVEYAYLEENTITPFVIGGKYGGQAFNKEPLTGKVSNTSIGLGYWGSENFKGGDFVASMKKKFPLTGDTTQVSFISLNAQVKGDQLLGYKYIDKDSTYADVYAFKYLNAIAMDQNRPRFISWKNEANAEDTALYVQAESEFDKLYFSLTEMTGEYIKPYRDAYKDSTYVQLTKESTAAGKKYEDYADLYKRFTTKRYNYVNADSVVLEHFGYYDPKDGIKDMKPLARQAYRLMLQDYYYWSPTIDGDYVTVGEQDRYILSDRVYAAKKYVPKSGRVEGLFGIPHFYFRNTYFDVQEAGDDYFALVQRLDAYRDSINGQRPSREFGDFGDPTTMSDFREWLTLQWGAEVAKRIINNIKWSDVKDDKDYKIGMGAELGFAVAQVEPYTTRLKMALRGESATTISTFQLDQDNAPIYRRFYGNDDWQDEPRTERDAPEIMEFHVLNDGVEGYRLYENYGSYNDGITEPVTKESDRYDAAGGRIYNLTKDGYFQRDSVNNNGKGGHVISFLGANNDAQWNNPDLGTYTNYAFYVDTAYINRGTGWLKPQYMLVVDPYIPDEEGYCDPATGDTINKNGTFVLGRYLYNGAQYAKVVRDSILDEDYDWIYSGQQLADPTKIINQATNKGFGASEKIYDLRTNNYNKVEPINANKIKYNQYIWDYKWERLAFAWAIHYNDKLYVLKGIDALYNNNTVNDPKDVYDLLVSEYGDGKAIDFVKLVNECKVGNGYQELYWPKGPNYPAVNKTYYDYQIPEGKTIGLHAVIDLDDNTHKDWVFSFRYVERRSDDFVIESETTERHTRTGAVIRPGYGGWVKFIDGVPVISRTTYGNHELMGEAQGSIFNVKRSYKDGPKFTMEDPVSNEAVAKVAVVGGTGNVTILNATGKKVVISNILGQTVANTIITSNNATIAAPAGVVVVAVEGEEAAKVVVK